MQSGTLNQFEFMAGGGEAGKVIRSIDWAKTTVGDPAEWPQSLRTTIGLLLHSSIPMYLAWGNDYIQFYNDEYSRISGLSTRSDSSIGRSTKETHDNTWGEIKPVFDQIREGKYVQSHDSLLLSGLAEFSDEEHFSFSYNPVYMEAGGVGGILVMLAEILTPHIETLRQTEEQFHGMTTEIEDYAILLLDVNGNVRNWNRGAEKIKGYKAEEIVGKNFRIFYPQKDQQERLPERLLNEAATKGKATHEGWRIRKDGTKFWGSIVITAYHNRMNEIIGFSKVTRDLTERKLTEEALHNYAAQLERKNLELQRSNSELMSFSYVASHDLQEPLRKIQAFSNLILEHDAHLISDTGKDYFNRMIKASNRMQALIDSLLEFSRTTTSQKKFEKADLNVLVEEVKLELREQIEESKAEIKSTVLPYLTVVPFQFKQLLYNLFSNAIKYAKKDQVPVINITSSVLTADAIDLERANPGVTYVRLSVTDNGIGFEQEYSDKIFELFQRLHARHEYTGSGIGLAICKKIAENHNGFMSAESEPGKGATFHVYLPAEMNAAKAE